MYRDSDTRTDVTTSSTTRGVSLTPDGASNGGPPGRDPGPDQPVDASWERAVEEMDVDQLRSLVLSQPVIEQAKGVLMAYYGVDAAAAFAMLRRWSSVHRVKLRVLAGLLLDHAPGTPPDRAGTGDPGAEWRPFDSIRARVEAAADGRV